MDLQQLNCLGAPDAPEFEQLLRIVVKDAARTAIQPCFEQFLEQIKVELRQEISKFYSSPSQSQRSSRKGTGDVMAAVMSAKKFKRVRLLRNQETSQAKKHIEFLDRTTNLMGPVGEDSEQSRFLRAMTNSTIFSQKSTKTINSSDVTETADLKGTLRDIAKTESDKVAVSCDESAGESFALGRQDGVSGPLDAVIARKAPEIDPFSDKFEAGDSQAVPITPSNYTFTNRVSIKKEIRKVEKDGTNSDASYAKSPQQRIQRLVRHPYFLCFIYIVVFINAIVVGLQVDYVARDVTSDVPVVYRVLDLIMLAFFTVELSLRLFAERRRFFSLSAPMWQWNIFDSLLVLSQMFEEVLMLIHTLQDKETTTSNALPSSLFSVARILRAIRVIRVLRVTKFLEELQLLISCILYSFRSFVWSLALMTLMVYVMGIFMAGICSDNRLQHVDDPASPEWEDLTKWFGNVPIAMLSLFQAVTGGIDWNDIMYPLYSYVSIWASLAAIFYVSFTVLVVLNIVTGTFVNSAMERASDVTAMNKVMEARKVFKAIDQDGSGFITVVELEKNLEDQAVIDYFDTINVDTTEAKGLFKMLDVDDSGRIELDEFLGMCLRLQGTAKAVDLLTLTRDIIATLSQMAVDVESVKLQLQKQDPLPFQK